MTKPVAILTGAAIFMVGCQKSHRSDTWKKVVSTPRPAPREAEDETRAYAANLHGTLLKARVPHKVVTAEFEYHSEYRRYGKARRTVVVYRDQTRSGEGWWLMDERLNVPLWLPNQPLEKQISFYLARPATLVQVSDFMGLDRGKLILPEEKAAPRKSGVTRIEPVEPVGPKPAAAPKPAPARKVPGKEAQSRITPVEKPAAKLAPKAGGQPVGAPEPKSDYAPASAPRRGLFSRIFGPKSSEQPVAKPAEKAPPKPVAKPVTKTPAKPADQAANKPAEKPAAKPVEKSVAKPVEKPVAKPPPAGQPAEKPAKPEPPKEAVKPPAKKEAKPAIKAEPSGKPPKKPELYDKSDSTPQATILPEEGGKKPAEDEEKSKPAATEPPKTSLFKRLFGRLFRA